MASGENLDLPAADKGSWQATDDGNLAVLNNTADFYRFFDATPHVEFVYRCVQHTLEKDLPQENLFLQRFDRFRIKVQTMVDTPDVIEPARRAP
jgi:hypothetical protein